MPLCLPYSRSKNYLGGIDWMIHALDASSRKMLGCGTSFAVVMELASPWNEEKLRNSFNHFCRRFPVLNGCAGRDWNLAPYWKKKAGSGRPSWVSQSVSSRADGFSKLTEMLNQNSDNHFPVNVVSVLMPDSMLVSFIFDHRLFDARGAEAFLAGFQEFQISGLCSSEFKNAPAGLEDWSSKFAAGRKVNRRRIEDEKEPVSRLTAKPGQNCFFFKNFSASESAAIFARAGQFSFLPYALAGAMRAVYSLFEKRAESPGSIAASVTRDMRAGQTAYFFNHLSFLFFKLKPQAARSRPAGFAEIQKQLYSQIKDKMPEALAEAGMLLRIVPLFILSNRIDSAPVTFSFAYLGDSAYKYDCLAGSPVMNIFHMPRIPPSPGLGIFFAQHRGKLNMTVSYIDSMISADEAAGIAAEAGDL